MDPKHRGGVARQELTREETRTQISSRIVKATLNSVGAKFEQKVVNHL